MTLNGQDIGEAEGALTAVLNRTLNEAGVSRTVYIALRVLAAQGPFESAAALRDYFLTQPQLGLDQGSADELIADLDKRGLMRDGTITEAGAELNARLAAAVRPATQQVFANVDAGDLAIAARVVRQITSQAKTIAGIS